MAKRSSRGAATAALETLDAAGVGYVVHRYDHDPAEHHFGQETVAALGVAPERICKTLVADADGELVVAVVPVAGRLDLKALAAAVGAKRAELADPAAAQRSTGYIVGGISPLGQRTRLRTVVDASTLEHETILVSAGRRGMQVELAPADLIELSGAAVAPIGR